MLLNLRRLSVVNIYQKLHQSQKGIKPKKITQVAHECKHQALTINAQMSAIKAKAAQKIKVGYETMGQGLAELIAASK